MSTSKELSKGLEDILTAAKASIGAVEAVRDRESKAVVDKYVELDGKLGERAATTAAFVAEQYESFLAAIQELDRLATANIRQEQDRAVQAIHKAIDEGIQAIRAERDRDIAAVRQRADSEMANLKTAAENALAIIEG